MLFLYYSVYYAGIHVCLFGDIPQRRGHRERDFPVRFKRAALTRTRLVYFKPVLPVLTQGAHRHIIGRMLSGWPLWIKASTPN